MQQDAPFWIILGFKGFPSGYVDVAAAFSEETKRLFNLWPERRGSPILQTENKLAQQMTQKLRKAASWPAFTTEKPTISIL